MYLTDDQKLYALVAAVILLALIFGDVAHCRC